MYVVYCRMTGWEYNRFPSLDEAEQAIHGLHAENDYEAFTWRFEP